MNAEFAFAVFGTDGAELVSDEMGVALARMSEQLETRIGLLR